MRLGELRESMDLRQQDVADHLEIPVTTYRKYEYEKRPVPLDVLLNLADYYGVSIDYLVGAERSQDDARKTQLDSMYRMLDERGRDLLMTIAKLIVKSGDYLSI